MSDVRNVYVTAEVAKVLDLTPAYLIRLAKSFKDDGILDESMFREAGKRNYIFSDDAINIIREKTNR